MKMACESCNYFLLHFPFITLIIFLSIVLSNCDSNTNYTACSILYSCGHIHNVGYPFWGDSRPKFCGIPDLMLSCKPKNNHTYPTIHVSQNGLHSQGDVLQINASSHEMVVNQTDLFEYCHAKKSWNNKKPSLTPSFKLCTGYNQSIQLFYGCNSSCVPRSQYTCHNSDYTNGTVYYFGNQSDINRVNKSCSCESNVSFSVDNGVLDKLSSRGNASSSSLLSVLTKWQFQVEYIANFSACSKCEQSGGRCGSSVHPSSHQFLCHCPGGSHPLMCPRVSDKKKNLGVALGLGVGGVCVLAASIAIWLCKKQKLGSSRFENQSASLDCSASELERGSVHLGVPLFSYSELVEATDNFDQSKELGNGGFGTVYYGKLKDGREVAVKRLYEKNYKRIEQFMNEVHILTRLRHHNLVSLYGCTSQHCRELLLVYEFVKNGTVSDHLLNTNTNSQPSLSWPVRLRIAVETATALSYLHASDIIHRDVKTDNILLDSKFSVKVADFGLSRLFPTDVTHVSTAPQGTPGYLDPEYNQCYQLTDKSDVYSFGVVLIELISSLPAVDLSRHRNEINLSNYAINRIQRCEFNDLVDPQLGFESDFKVRRMTISVAELAFQCLQQYKEFRPSMDEVLEVLKRIEDADYDALLLQGEDMGNKPVEDEVNLDSSNLLPPPSPTEDVHAQLLCSHQLQPPSPISVMEEWVSTSRSSK